MFTSKHYFEKYYLFFEDLEESSIKWHFSETNSLVIIPFSSFVMFSLEKSLSSQFRSGLYIYLHNTLAICSFNILILSLCL